MFGWQAADLCPSLCHLTIAFSKCAEPCSVPGSAPGAGHTAMSKHPQSQGALSPAVDSCPVWEAADKADAVCHFISLAPTADAARGPAGPAPAQRARPTRHRHVFRVGSELLAGLQLVPSEVLFARRQGSDSRPQCKSQLCPGKPWAGYSNILSFGIIWIYSIGFTSY